MGCGSSMRGLARAGWLCAVLAINAAAAPERDDTDWPAWVDAEEKLRQQIAQVNDGELVFLDRDIGSAIHHHSTRILISDRSLVDGWVVLEQCHDHLDRVSAAQILFNPERSRALEVVSFRNMDTAFAQDNTIQLRGIRDASEVCLRAESRALHLLDAGVFELQNGPFMRRFLDGYYPLRVSLQIDHPADLMLADFSPEAQPGFRVRQMPGHVSIEALFEGQLRTRLRFLAP